MPQPRKARVNLSTIADRLGVSVSTVSRALRGMDGIHEETRRQAVELARTLGYPVDERISALPTQPPPQLFLALSQCTSLNFDQAFLAGMTSAGVAHNASVLAHLVTADRCHSVLEPAQQPPALRAGQVQGIALLHRWPADVAAALSERFPTVSVVHEYSGLPIDHVGIDDRGGVDAVVGHLLGGGHRKIGFFGLCPEVSWARSRYSAFVESLMARDAGFSPANVVQIDLAAAMSPEEFPPHSWAGQLRDRVQSGVNAWFCPSATTGETLLRFCLAQAWRVPDDVAVASFHGNGNSVPYPRDLPAITTTQVPDEEIGATAIRRLVSRLENPGESRRSILLPARLVPGATTKTTASASPLAAAV